jgi:hypothetical protein
LNGVTVHKKLSESPLPTLEAVAKEFFEKVLGQKLSDEPVRVVQGMVYTK